MICPMGLATARKSIEELKDGFNYTLVSCLSDECACWDKEKNECGLKNKEAPYE